MTGQDHRLGVGFQKEGDPLPGRERVGAGQAVWVNQTPFGKAKVGFMVTASGCPARRAALHGERRIPR